MQGGGGVWSPDGGVCPGGSRSRSAADALQELLAEGGCRLVVRQLTHTARMEYLADDPWQLRLLLARRLAVDEPLLRHEILAGLEACLQGVGELQAALQPMTGKDGAAVGPSLVHLLLNTERLQVAVARLLLRRLAKLCGSTFEPDIEAARLIPAHFQELAVLVDGSALAEAVLGALPSCPPDLRGDLLCALADVAPEEEHEGMLHAALDLWHSKALSLRAFLEAASRLSLPAEAQHLVVALMLMQLINAEPQELPALVRFLLQQATPSQARSVCALLRDELHFLPGTNDPRQDVVPRNRQPSNTPHRAGASGSQERAILEAFRQGMLLNPLAADGMLSVIQDLDEPEEHKALDFWVLLLMHHSMGPARRQEAQRLLADKLAAGRADGGWLQRAVTGHEEALAELFPALLGIARQLVQTGSGGAPAAGADLLDALLTCFQQPACQQDVLRVLRSHLASGAPSELAAVLGSLARMSKDSPSALLQHAAPLATSLLECTASCNTAQLRELFSVLSQLAAASCQSNAQEARAVVSDQLLPFLRKALADPQPACHRAGAVGVVALVLRLAEGIPGSLETRIATGSLLSEAKFLLYTTLEGVQCCPGVCAALCEELAQRLETKHDEQDVPRGLMEELHYVVEGLWEETFLDRWQAGSQGVLQVPPGGVGEVQVGAALLQRSAWWGLSGGPEIVALDLLQHLALDASAAPGSAPEGVSVLGAMLPLFRLHVVLSKAISSCYKMDDMQGYGLVLFPMDLATRTKFPGLPVDQQRLVLAGLFHAHNWCRQLLNSFAGGLDANGIDFTIGQVQLLARLRCCCQLGALMGILEQRAAAGLGLSLPAGSPHSLRGEAGLVPAAAAAAELSSMFTAGAADPAAQCGGRWGRLCSLQLPATEALRLLPRTHSSTSPCYAALAPAAYLLGDLLGKLHAVLGEHSPLPPESQELTPTQLLETVQRLAPAMRRHLDTALSLLREELSDKSMADHDKQYYWRPALDLSQHVNLQEESVLVEMPGNGAAQAALSPNVAAPRVATLVLECLLCVLHSPAAIEPAQRPALRAVLLAFRGEDEDSGDEEEMDEGDDGNARLLTACKVAFLHLAGLMADVEQAQHGGWPKLRRFSYCYALLRVLAALTALTPRVHPGGVGPGLLAGAPLTLASQMGRRVSNAAHEVLRQDWDWRGSPKAGTGRGWAARAAELQQVVHTYLSCGSPTPAALISKVAAELLSKVPDAAVAQPGQEPVEKYPSIGAATLPAWCRAALEVLKGWLAAPGAIYNIMDAAGGLEGPVFVGLVDLLQECACAFHSLMAISQQQPRHVEVLSLLMRSGGELVDLFTGLLPFWATAAVKVPDSCLDIIQEVQDGIRILQALCAEAKQQQDLELVDQVPSLTLALERFVFETHAALLEAGWPAGSVFWLGSLKHKNLEMVEVPEELYPAGVVGSAAGEALESEGEEASELEQFPDTEVVQAPPPAPSQLPAQPQPLAAQPPAQQPPPAQPAAQQQQPAAQAQPPMACPICGMLLPPGTSNAALNAHVDQCLAQVAGD